MLCLQNGKFDTPDRMFLSISKTYQSCLENPTDVKELIPEFFIGNGDFLLNKQRLELGQSQQGHWIDHVELPKWCKSPSDFINFHRMALESTYVSQNLHHWIDLIFGYSQRGANAEQCDNLFYHLTYENEVDLAVKRLRKQYKLKNNNGSNSNSNSNSSSSRDHSMDIRDRTALETQICEFGQCPSQLFTIPHVAKKIW